MPKIHAYTDATERRTSSSISPVRAGLLAGFIATHMASAQDTVADSLADRLRRAEAAIAALQVQISEQSQSGLQTRSRARMEVNGRVMVNAFGNSRRVNNVDNPQFVQPDPAAGVPIRGGGMAIRQTRLGLVVTVPEALGGVFTGDVDVDFYGGQTPSGGGRTFPLLRLRTARGTVRWSHAELMIGQETPLVSGLNPVSPVAIGTPAFAAAGNLWLWLPQVRGGVGTDGRLRVGAKAAVLAPTSGDPAAPFDTDNDVAERSQRPYLQARVHAAWGDADMTGEVGCGIHQGWLVPVADRERSQALACDALIPLSNRLEVRGEFFTGQALRGLGGGGIGQNFTPLNEPLETSGGWAQLNVRATSMLRLGAGCGGDHPRAASTRHRNDACAAYALVRPLGPLFVAAEYRRLRTSYSAGSFVNDHVTFGAGFEF